MPDLGDSMRVDVECLDCGFTSDRARPWMICPICGGTNARTYSTEPAAEAAGATGETPSAEQDGDE